MLSFSMKTNKRLIALVVALVLVITTVVVAAPIYAASDNTVSLTLYNDTTIPEGTSYPPAYTDSYVWEKSENTSDVFRLVIDMNFNKKYATGEIELIIDAFCPASRETPIKRTSIGGGSGVFKETAEETTNSGIKVTNAAPVNGSASLSVTYQIKPELMKDLGTLGSSLNLKCTLTADGETVASNEISFSTDFAQSWSIINSGEHEEVYDEIEVYRVNNNTPLNYEDRLLTIDNVIIAPTTVENSDYYWVEYRVPLLSEDPLGLYKHYIEIGLPDGCALYSAQAEMEDAQVTIPQALKYIVNSETNTVTVDCVDYINEPHSINNSDDNSDSYYYFVIALDKSTYNNTDVVSFREKHVHKDKNSVVGYSENQETYSEKLKDWGTDTPKFVNVRKFSAGVAKENFKSGYKSITNSVVFNAPVSDSVRVSSEVPFTSDAVNSSTKTTLSVDEYDVTAVEIPAHYLDDTGEIVYGITYTVFTSSNGVDFTEYESGKITEDKTVNLPDGVNYAYVVYNPTDTDKCENFYTYGMGSYSYGVSPRFVYEFNITDETFLKMEDDTFRFIGIIANVGIEGFENSGSMTNYITLEDLTKEYRIHTPDEITAKLVKNKYEITATHTVDLYSNSTNTTFSRFAIMSILPDNYYGKDITSFVEKAKETLSLTEIVSDNSIPLTITNGTETITINSDNILDYVTVTGRITDEGNAVLAFNFNFGDYAISLPENNKSINFTYTWLMSRLNQEDFGTKKVFDTISSMSVLDDVKAIPATEYPYLPGTNFFPSADDGSFATAVSSISISQSALSDINNNSKTDDTLYFSKTNISVTDTGETAQATTMEIASEYTALSTTTYVNPAQTRTDKEYTLAFSFDGYGSEYTEIAFISNLGNSSEDNSDWFGTLNSVENAVTTSGTELNTKVYFNTETVVLKDTISSVKNSNTIQVTDDWVLREDYDGELADIKSVIVIVSGDIPVDETIRVDVKMQSTDEAQCTGLYNSSNFAVLAVSSTQGVSGEAYSGNAVIQLVNSNVTYIKRIKANDINLANGTPTFVVEITSDNENISFPIVFDERYTEIEINGVKYYELSFDLSDKLGFGTYTVSEIKSLRYGSPTYEVSEGEGTVNNGTVVFQTTFESSKAVIISTSEKTKHNNLSHNDICINSFNNPVE